MINIASAATLTMDKSMEDIDLDEYLIIGRSRLVGIWQIKKPTVQGEKYILLPGGNRI